MKARISAVISGICIGFLTQLFIADLRPLPASLVLTNNVTGKVRLLDRSGTALTESYLNRWNINYQTPLHLIPETLQMLFIFSEDQRFFSHQGNDFKALASAVFNRLMDKSASRGASTISEQVVRMLHPRERTFWSRALELVEARKLEKKFTKAQILEFYLNQVPYSRNRRGVTQAALTYFNRDLETLSLKEMLALVVFVRSPSKFDPTINQSGRKLLERRIELLSQRLASSQSILAARLAEQDLLQPLGFAAPSAAVDASHFIHFARQSIQDKTDNAAALRTSLDLTLQKKLNRILRTRLKNLATLGAKHGALLVVENQTGEILSWVTASASKAAPSYDAVLVKRQPGSTLKPFVYAEALSQGYQANTIINDSPLALGMQAGLKEYKNFSEIYYGPVSMRQALGNSLNIPAILTARTIGVAKLYNTLRQLGFDSLMQDANYYGEGLALGNGEVSLYELVRAYYTLASGGLRRELKALISQPEAKPQRIFSPEVSSIIANILSDPSARLLEFGHNSLLNFPVQTAVKTGTSSNFRDAWAVGFSRNYTAGVWLGNLDGTAMTEITGATGPILVLRAIFAELERQSISKPLWQSPKLIKKEICLNSQQTSNCKSATEYFISEAEASSQAALDNNLHSDAHCTRPVHLELPSPGLILARDPRIPDADEAFPFTIERSVEPSEVIWFVDHKEVGKSIPNGRTFLWNLEKGRHIVHADLKLANCNNKTIQTPQVAFTVK
ncbi:transglycosylase domain-containing protein [bacterium]|nr:transglycosylase domain-containing protein [bacterium]